MIKREDYLRKLRMYRDEPLIKVVTGVRRAGKSTLLQMFREELVAEGVAPERVLYLNFEEEGNEELLDRHALMDYIRERLVEGEMNYVFLDEVQKVGEFEILVDALFVKPNVDIYVTGSNAYMLSGELATYLSGRYVEINILPFSFREFLGVFENNLDINQRFNQYLHYSSFPQAAQMVEQKPEAVNGYLRGVYESVMVKDVLQRKGVRSRGNLERVLRYAMDNVGNLMSPNRVANVLWGGEARRAWDDDGDGVIEEGEAARGATVKGATVEGYLEALTESFVLYKAERWDVKGKKLLQTLEKYYTVDLGLRRILLGRNDSEDVGRMLENVVYLELKRRGGEVFVGKVGNEHEIDFVVKTAEGGLEYYQVAYTVAGEETLRRELAALKAVRDNYPKTLLSLDPLGFDEGGIRHVNVVSWLMEGGKRGEK